jgi:hypothetical protein
MELVSMESLQGSHHAGFDAASKLRGHSPCDHCIGILSRLQIGLSEHLPLLARV